MLRKPDSSALMAYLWIGIQLGLTFTILYGGTNWLAAQRSFSAKLWTPWELAIPMLPYMIIPYFSIHLLMAMPLITLDGRQIRALGKSFLLATFFASLIFLLLPAHLGFIRNTENLGTWQPLYEFLYSLDKTANTFPSLHITYTALTVRGITFYKQKSLLKNLLLGWALVIMASVLFTHQHHLIDILGGVLLAELCFWNFSAKET